MKKNIYNTFLYVLGIAICLLESISAAHWAVIVVGSRGFSNYRHQSDACHAYHVVRNHGIPEQNVILMMYDDIATHQMNPFPGKLFNKPSVNDSDEGFNVYEGCNVTYRGMDVTPEMFMNVLLGNKTATGGRPVLESTSEDRVFVNFVDHGSRGFVLFPHGAELHAVQLEGILKLMYAQKKYKELVFYMEACESGSMFRSHLPSNINVFVTTAANRWESSWGTYCPPHDIVNGKKMGTCLGDLYSVNWIEDSDVSDLSKETLQDQFLLVKQETTKSHVREFGSKPVRKEVVGNFQSTLDASTADDDDENFVETSFSLDNIKQMSAIEAHDIDLVTAFYQYVRASAGKSRERLMQSLIEKLERRQRADETFERIKELSIQKLHLDEFPSNAVPTRFDCHAQLQQSLHMNCEGLVPLHDDYNIKYMGTLVDICETSLDLKDLQQILKLACMQTKAKLQDKKILQSVE
jgi:legumain